MISTKKKIMGWLLMILGLVILLTPFTPGSILLIIGADMVFGDEPDWQRLKRKIKSFFWE